MTVPFIMALGVGVSAIRSDRHAADDSFGLVALCSIGPILAVRILGMLYRPSEAAFVAPGISELGSSVELWETFRVALPAYMKEIAIALLPIILFFAVFQAVSLKIAPAQTAAGSNWACIYLSWACFIPHRCKCRLYAGRKLSWPDNCRSGLSLDTSSLSEW